MIAEMRRRDLLAGGLALPAFVVQRSSARTGRGRPATAYDSLLRPTVFEAGMRGWTLAERMAHHRVPGACVGILRDGAVVDIRGHGTRLAGALAPIGSATLFSVGSISKVVTAALCLRLVALGQLDLDLDVGRWLRRWRVPPGPGNDGGAITLRMLLSHTAGFNVHGFADFAPGAPLPTLADTLAGAAPATNSPLARVEPAGERARYSGGGYMLVQAVVEDAMGESLDALARAHVFAPLGMTRSSFSATLSPRWGDIAHAHDRAGRPATAPPGWQSFPELAASGLWTCAEDLLRLVAGLIRSHLRVRDPFLPPAIVEEMMTPVSPGLFGLGPRLAGVGSSAIFHHGGANDSYKAYIEGNLARGDGLVILTNGANGDVLGDEIRNAVSDAYGWPGDWSVGTRPSPGSRLLAGYTGAYRRRPDQARELTGLLDTSFDHARLEIRQAGDRLDLHIEERVKPLAPLGGGRFVVPDAYVPAGTLQMEFKRAADRSVGSVVVRAAGGCLLFDRR